MTWWLGTSSHTQVMRSSCPATCCSGPLQHAVWIYPTILGHHYVAEHMIWAIMGPCLAAALACQVKVATTSTGNKRQIKDQELKSGDQALLVNLALALPVRLLRKE